MAQQSAGVIGRSAWQVNRGAQAVIAKQNVDAPDREPAAAMQARGQYFVCGQPLRRSRAVENGRSKTFGKILPTPKLGWAGRRRLGSSPG